MKRQNRPLWNIVPKTVRDKVAQLWPDTEATMAYLSTRSQTTLRSRDAIWTAATHVEGNDSWASSRVEADTDLARVYAFAAWYVSQLATHLQSREDWSAVDMDRARTLLQNP